MHRERWDIGSIQLLTWGLVFLLTRALYSHSRHSTRLRLEMLQDFLQMTPSQAAANLHHAELTISE